MDRDAVLRRAQAIGGELADWLDAEELESDYSEAPEPSLLAVCDLVEKFPVLNKGKALWRLFHFVTMPHLLPVEEFVDVIQGCIQYVNEAGIKAAFDMREAEQRLFRHQSHTHLKPDLFNLLRLLDALARVELYPTSVQDFTNCSIHFCKRSFENARQVVADDYDGFWRAMLKA
jgi:hypothetical protein